MRRRLPLSMQAGVRLTHTGKAPDTYFVTTLRDDRRLEFSTLEEAKKAFALEVEASKNDPRVGPYVRG